jgi:hypothetical protein
MKFSPAWAILVAAFLAGGCGKSDHTEPAASDNLVTAPVKYIGAAVTNQQIAVKAIDLVSLNQEVQLFNVQEGRYPKSLDELVAKQYVGQLPAPPFGTKIVYDPVQGKVTLVQP